MAIVSLYKRFIALLPGTCMLVQEPYEGNTVRNYASNISRLTGRRFSVHKTEEGFIVYRHE